MIRWAWSDSMIIWYDYSNFYFRHLTKIPKSRQNFGLFWWQLWHVTRFLRNWRKSIVGEQLVHYHTKYYRHSMIITNRHPFWRSRLWWTNPQECRDLLHSDRTVQSALIKMNSILGGGWVSPISIACTKQLLVFHFQTFVLLS